MRTALASPIPFGARQCFCLTMWTRSGSGLLDGVGSFSLQLGLSYSNFSYSGGQGTLVGLLPASKKNIHWIDLWTHGTHCETGLGQNCVRHPVSLCPYSNATTGTSPYIFRILGLLLPLGSSESNIASKQNLDLLVSSSPAQYCGSSEANSLWAHPRNVAF